MLSLQNYIDTVTAAFDKKELNDSDKSIVLETIHKLDAGEIRVAEKILETEKKSKAKSSENNHGKWITHEWVKKAVLLYFRIQGLQEFNAGDLSFYDKIPLKKWNAKSGVRVVPHAIARYGSFISKGAILMPSYVNIGAYVGEGTMVDTWATVGSCAQIGAHCHLSGGVGIGGVLEPVQASPVIIEDNCFLGSRAIVVEGVHVKQGAVLGAGVTLTASTKIYDVTNKKVKEYRSEIPENSVVIPGTKDKKFPAGTYGVPCALIIGKRKESTDKKTSLNQALRDFGVSV